MSFRQIFDRISRIARSSDMFSGGDRDDLRRAQELIDGERRREEREKREREEQRQAASQATTEDQAVRDARRVLNVSESATLDEITRAYRQRIVEVHPDRHAGDPDAEERAKALSQQLNEAYAVLKAARTT